MSILTFLEENNIEIASANHHHSRIGWANIDCSLCTPNSRHFRLGINLEKKYASCWSCGWRNLTKALMELTGKTWQECQEVSKGGEVELDVLEKKGKLVIPKGVGEVLSCHKGYLKSRNLDPDFVITTYGIKGIGLSVNLSWRIFIPIIYQGKTRSWITRSIGEKGVRYINARPDQEEISCKKLLFGDDLAGHSAIICEGCFDAMRIGIGAVATLGTSFSKSQVQKMSRFSKRIIVFDSEVPAQEKARGLCSLLEGLPGKTIRVELDAKDPSSAKQSEINQLRRMLK